MHDISLTQKCPENNNIFPTPPKTKHGTWNLKLIVSRRNLLFQGLVFSFHVKLRGGVPTYAHNFEASSQWAVILYRPSNETTPRFRHHTAASRFPRLPWLGSPKTKRLSACEKFTHFYHPPNALQCGLHTLKTNICHLKKDYLNRNYIISSNHLFCQLPVGFFLLVTAFLRAGPELVALVSVSWTFQMLMTHLHRQSCDFKTTASIWGTQKSRLTGRWLSSWQGWLLGYSPLVFRGSTPFSTLPETNSKSPWKYA